MSGGFCERTCCQKLSRAALSYEKFLEDSPEEQSWLREWDAADLATAPKRTRR